MKREKSDRQLAEMTRGQEILTAPHIGALRKYMKLVVGEEKGWPSLILYEIVTVFLAGMRGAPGYFLRQKIYPSIFRDIGPRATIGHNVTVRHPGRITLGKDVAIDDNVLLDARDGKIIIGDRTIISRNSIIVTRGGSISIGADCSIGTDVKIATLGSLIIEDYALIAAYCYVGGGNHRHDCLDVPIVSQGMEEQKGVFIGHGAWIGAGTIVLDGVSVGSGAIIGASSLVKQDIPDLAVGIGQPAKVIRFRNGR